MAGRQTGRIKSSSEVNLPCRKLKFTPGFGHSQIIETELNSAIHLKPNSMCRSAWKIELFTNFAGAGVNRVQNHEVLLIAVPKEQLNRVRF
jgi:hypothetical protein